MIPEFLLSELGALTVYAVPFVIAVLMPGWRALAAVGLTLGGLIVFAFVRLSTEDVPGGASLGHAMMLGLLVWAGAGHFAGVITRAIDLARSPGSLASRAGIFLAGFALLPGLFFAWSWWRL